MARPYAVPQPRIAAIDKQPQDSRFYDWLRNVEEQLERVVPSSEAARLYNEGVAVMDAVVRLGRAL